MNVPQLVDYFGRMNHERERLAVLPGQLNAFLEKIGDTIDLDIQRAGGVFYVRDLLDQSPFERTRLGNEP